MGVYTSKFGLLDEKKTVPQSNHSVSTTQSYDIMDDQQWPAPGGNPYTGLCVWVWQLQACRQHELISFLPSRYHERSICEVIFTCNPI